jgi:type II pantothenate kinase
MKRIGIDAGGSLIKLSYEEKGQLHLKTYSLDEKEKLTSWLHMLAPDAYLYGTGGKWSDLKDLFSHKKETVEEFPALVRGTNYLLDTEGNRLREYVLVSIGTGTSIFSVKGEQFERILGTGIGGGTWMGLGSLLSNQKTFQGLVEESKNGNRRMSDLLVKDIYGTNAPLSVELTAANFGNAHRSEGATTSDHLQALHQMIGEVIISLAGTVLQQKNMKDIVFIGSTLQGNEPLKIVLMSFKESLSYHPIFLDRGSHAGAVGAMLT